MSDLTSLSAYEMRQGLLRKEFSALELTEAHLARIKATNETYNSFITISEESAIDAAQKADERLAKSAADAPPLLGIPVSVKDMIITEGVETTCGSKMLKGFIPPYQSTVMRRLTAQGAVLLGKTNMDEFGMGSSSEQSAFGPVRNPWDTERVPGGSSGGSAVSVACGQAPLSLGTDTGGSIRQPAAFTGILGLKPTYGRVSRYGVVAYASSCDQVGPMARTTKDLAVLLSAVSGKDHNDSTSMDRPVPDYVAELDAQTTPRLNGLRIGIPKGELLEGVQEDILHAFNESLNVLKTLGAEIVDVTLPHLQYALAAYYIIVPAEAASNLARFDGVRYGVRAPNSDSLAQLYERSRALGFGPEVKRRIMVGSYVLSAGYFDAYYGKAQQVRTLIINDFKAAFANTCDLIATPISAASPYKLGEKMSSPLEMYRGDAFTVPVSLVGAPALSLPCGTDKLKMPVGLQLIAPPFEELRLLNTAQAFLKEQPFTLAPLQEEVA